MAIWSSSYCKLLHGTVWYREEQTHLNDVARVARASRFVAGISLSWQEALRQSADQQEVTSSHQQPVISQPKI